MRDLFRCAAIVPGLESHRCAQHRTSRVVVLGEPLWLCATRGASLFRAMEAMAWQQTRRAAQLRTSADWLQFVLAEYSEIPIDSLAIYPAIVALQDSTIAAQGAAITGLDSALVASDQSGSVQRSIIAAQGARITVLEQQLAAAPKPPRLELRLLGGRFRRGCAAGVDARLDPRLVCGVTVTR